MNLIQTIHAKAIRCARQFHQAESELLVALQQVDARKVFRHLGYTSLFEYATQSLKLSESNAYAFITVARKAVEVPQIREAISQGILSVSKAKRVTSVIRPENQHEWIAKAQKLTQRELEREIVKVNPRQAVREVLKPISAHRTEMRVGISSDLEKKLKRVQDVLSQNKKRAVTMEEALEEVMDLFLERKDPVAKAERSLKKTTKPFSRKVTVVFTSQKGKRPPIPAAIKHRVYQRDKGKCVQCQSSKWVELHHKTPVSQGGTHDENNLITLCSAHHKIHHSGTTLSSALLSAAMP